MPSNFNNGSVVRLSPVNAIQGELCMPGDKSISHRVAIIAAMEGSGENVFLIKDGRIFTNDERHSILLGITRDVVIKIARDLGYSVEMCAISLEDLLDADEAFFTGTAAEVVPIREVDGSVIGLGMRGLITTKIQDIFALATVGRDPRYYEWLHPVAP